jgi:phospholipid transport system substrate-binding protein
MILESTRPMRLLFALLAFLFAPLVVADATAPDALVKNVSSEVLDIIRNDPDIQRGSMRKTIALVEEKVLPHFDFQRMTALAMGPSWRKATPQQQAQLVDQFRTLLVRTYSFALVAYRDQTLDFKPLRMQPTDTETVVKSEVRQPGQQPVSIDYTMQKADDSWKVYDVAVGGVSLVTTYRDTFNAEVRQGGVDGLIKSLADKNRQLEAGTK